MLSFLWLYYKKSAYFLQSCILKKKSQDGNIQKHIISITQKPILTLFQHFPDILSISTHNTPITQDTCVCSCCLKKKVMYLYSLWRGDRGVSGDDLNALWRSTHHRAGCRRCLCLQSTQTHLDI